jgi:hypothetical protein
MQIEPGRVHGAKIETPLRHRARPGGRYLHLKRTQTRDTAEAVRQRGAPTAASRRVWRGLCGCGPPEIHGIDRAVLSGAQAPRGPAGIGSAARSSPTAPPPA